MNFVLDFSEVKSSINPTKKIAQKEIINVFSIAISTKNKPIQKEMKILIPPALDFTSLCILLLLGISTNFMKDEYLRNSLLSKKDTRKIKI